MGRFCGNPLAVGPAGDDVTNPKLLIARGQLRAALTAAFIFALGSFTPLHAASLAVMWDSNTESNLAGYTIVYGTAPNQYSNSVDVGNHTSYTFTDLNGGTRYY